jgi:predicted transcriptional regulator
MTLRLNDDLDSRLTEYSRQSGISKQKITIIAIEAYLQRESQSTQAAGVIEKVLHRDQDLLARLADA